ncbi:hypothetical protein HHL16_17760 [Pseudoflavitalea sp. G-6-1-2]|uniref:hypothetical protein n=1 Tax=Pseudoflavitalea sp. G-6-1-2 TaxID=2728841 RepID=UPI001469C825|nr:hypothetical protein [Pseudoflavitalea sp. G-6-1-2]NML22735.1 hypothetical protein [Pseudoflavitalea sp. G-6-1-2]
MKQKILLLVVASVVFLASCSKSKTRPEDEEPVKPPGETKDVLVLQRYEDSSNILEFKYNDKLEVIRINKARKYEGEVIAEHYVTVTNEKGSPVKAELYMGSGSNYTRVLVISFGYDAQERVTKIARVYYNPDGQPNPRSGSFTQFVHYDGPQKVIRMEREDNGKTELELKFDAQGNAREADLKVFANGRDYDITHKAGFDDGANPFAVRRLGWLLYGIDLRDIFAPSQLFSQNNVTSYSRVEVSSLLIPEDPLSNEVIVRSEKNEFTCGYDGLFQLTKLNRTRAELVKYNEKVVEDKTTTNLGRLTWGLKKIPK